MYLDCDRFQQINKIKLTLENRPFCFKIKVLSVMNDKTWGDEDIKVTMILNSYFSGYNSYFYRLTKVVRVNWAQFIKTSINLILN